MLFAFFTDWGSGEKLMLLWLLVPGALLVHAARRFNERRDFDDCVWWVFLGLLALVLVSATVAGAESNRRETAQLTSRLQTLDVTVDHVTTSTPFTVVRLGDCRVTLDVRHPGDHRWTAAVKADAEAQVPIGPRLETRIKAYCAAKRVTE